MPIPFFIHKTADFIWEVPKTYKSDMRVPARIVATEKLISEMDEGVFAQIANVTTLPGIVGYAYAMPDAHWGYGAPVGAVFATDPDQGGIISPGAIGFDINCGMRLVRTNLNREQVLPKLPQLIEELFKRVPAGVGCRGIVKLNKKEFAEVIVQGANWCVEKGFGWEKDLEHMEEYGRIKEADPEKVSERAVERGIEQLGTLGSGNHYLEIQVVGPGQIFDTNQAKSFGIYENQVVVMLHCGSRGFGHQVATDYLHTFEKVMPKYGIAVRDRQLAAAPFNSYHGQAYFAAMNAAANSAFVNRQMITHQVREAFAEVFDTSAGELGMELVYDVAHNIAKLEEYEIDGKRLKLVVHRKGATRSFPGQPVIIGGSMETGSYLLVGTENAMKFTFGSTAHGSGRTMSRTAAKKQVRGDELQRSMADRGILVKSGSISGLAEEAGFAYKDIHEVVKSVEAAGISHRVAAFTPIGNIKG